MLNAKISALDLVLMAVYLVAIVGWGLFHSKRKNVADYFPGARHGTGLSLALANNSDTPREVRVTLPPGQVNPPLARYNYYPGDRFADEHGFPLTRVTLASADLTGGLSLIYPRAARLFAPR